MVTEYLPAQPDLDLIAPPIVYTTALVLLLASTGKSLKRSSDQIGHEKQTQKQQPVPVMARLNDPPPAPAETAEALKRRFIRQNREIARINSTQSQRIRNLETEISRLAAENISLREQVIGAETEAERWRSANSVSGEILDLKERLENKVREVTNIIVEMGELPEKAAARRRRRRSGAENLRRSNEQQWRDRQAMREALARERGEMQEGRLPSIQEDKLYPRRTLETVEMMAIRDEAALQDSTESPDIGPPPVAHFDVPDPVSFQPSPAEEQQSEITELPSIMERRRKRRTSALLQNMPTDDSMVQLDNADPRLLQTGAKRKLDISELEEPIIASGVEQDDFVFQRRQHDTSNVGPGKKASRFTRPPGRENEGIQDSGQQSPQKTLEPSRKILAPKSTNSPAKRKVTVMGKTDRPKDDGSEPQKPVPRRLSQRPNGPASDWTKKTKDGGEASTDPDELPPKTPAALGQDVFSPISTEPSIRSTYQTKEAAILNSVEDVLNGSIGRGSRRARAAVSYAEPSLRDKMRRPGKELVGAVEGLNGTRDSTSHSRSTSLDRVKSDGEKENGVPVKLESCTAENGTWKKLPDTGKKEDPTSPLKDKERKERQQEKNAAPAKSENTVRREKRTTEDLEQAVNRLSIFDAPVSSHMEEQKEPLIDVIRVTTTAKRKNPALAASRRHSVQPPASGINDSTLSSRTSTRAPPRSSSSASLRKEGSASKELKRSSSISSNLRGASTMSKAELSGDPENAAVPEADSRERMSSRRRSMMV